MKRSKKIAAVLLFLAVIILVIIIYAVPGVTGALTRTEILQYGNLKITDEMTCFFVRNEKVYTAAYAGRINYYVGDGVLVKTGTRILEIDAETPPEAESPYQDIITRLSGKDVSLYNCISEFKGITSYYIDGYESDFTPEDMRGLKYEQTREMNQAPLNVVRESALKGEPLYKICDNAKWYLIGWIDASSLPKYKTGRGVTINLPLGEVKAVITDIIEDGDKWLVILESNRYYEDFAKVRTAEATVVTSDYNGIIVRNASITTKDGAVGVYIRAKTGDYIFKPIKVITTDGENSLVEVSYYYDEQGNKVNTVNIYDEMLKNPNHD